jgi:hypothetical protein
MRQLSCLAQLRCGKKAGVDYIQENDSRQDAVSASDLHLNYSVSNGRTTVNVDADVNTSLSTQSAPVATAVRCDYTNEDITRIAAAIFDEGSYKLFLPYSRQSKENITAADVVDGPDGLRRKYVGNYIIIDSHSGERIGDKR